jgi:hypothetical protein
VAGSAPATAGKDSLLSRPCASGRRLGCGEFHGARAFDQHFAGFALRPFEAEERRVGLRIPLMERSIEIRNSCERWPGAFTFKVMTPIGFPRSRA